MSITVSNRHVQDDFHDPHQSMTPGEQLRGLLILLAVLLLAILLRTL